MRSWTNLAKVFKDPDVVSTCDGASQVLRIQLFTYLTDL